MFKHDPYEKKLLEFLDEAADRKAAPIFPRTSPVLFLGAVVCDLPLNCCANSGCGITGH